MKNEQLLEILIQDKNVEEKQDLLRSLQKLYVELIHNKEYKPQTSLEKQIMANITDDILPGLKTLINSLHHNITLSICECDNQGATCDDLDVNQGITCDDLDVNQGITCDDLDVNQGITCDDLDRAREEYGEEYDDYKEDTYGSNIPVIWQFRDFD